MYEELSTAERSAGWAWRFTSDVVFEPTRDSRCFDNESFVLRRPRNQRCVLRGTTAFGYLRSLRRHPITLGRFLRKNPQAVPYCSTNVNLRREDDWAAVIVARRGGQNGHPGSFVVCGETCSETLVMQLTNNATGARWHAHLNGLIGGGGGRTRLIVSA